MKMLTTFPLVWSVVVPVVWPMLLIVVVVVACCLVATGVSIVLRTINRTVVNLVSDNLALGLRVVDDNAKKKSLNLDLLIGAVQLVRACV